MSPTLHLLGSLDVDAAEFLLDPVWPGGDRLAATTSRDTLRIVTLAPGLPVVATTRFPGGLELPGDAPDPYELDFDRIGVHGLAMRPDGEAFAVAGVTAEHDRAVYIVGVDGETLAETSAVTATHLGVNEDFLICPIALAWSGDGAALWMCCSIENEHHVLRLDPTDLSVTGLVNLGGDFPEPALVVPLAHPRADAVSFEIACGQDGAWLRTVACGPAGVVRVATELDVLGAHRIFGVSPDGGVLYDGIDAFGAGGPGTWQRRRAPELAHEADFATLGMIQGGVVLGDHVAIAVTPDDGTTQLAIHRASDGAAVGTVELARGHRLVAGHGDVLVTRAGECVSVWRLALA